MVTTTTKRHHLNIFHRAQNAHYVQVLTINAMGRCFVCTPEAQHQFTDRQVVVTKKCSKMCQQKQLLVCKHGCKQCKFQTLLYMCFIKAKPFNKFVRPQIYPRSKRKGSGVLARVKANSPVFLTILFCETCQHTN